MSELAATKDAATAPTTGEAPATGEGSVGRCHSCGCVGPNPGYDSMEGDKLDEAMATLKPGHWTLAQDLKSISRAFTCRNFKVAVDFINRAAEVAEREDIQHHPDLHLTKYRDVVVTCWTHAADGLTQYDFKLARALDALDVDYSPKWLKAHPEVHA